MPVLKSTVTEYQTFDGSQKDWAVKKAKHRVQVEVKGETKWIYTDRILNAGGLGVPRKHDGFGGKPRSEAIEAELRDTGQLIYAAQKRLSPDVKGEVAVFGLADRGLGCDWEVECLPY